MKIEYEESFKKALCSGINLFCGAGFSVGAKNFYGDSLPLGKILLEKLKQTFKSIDIGFYTDLTKACTKIEKNDKSSFRKFIEKTYTVTNIDIKSGFDYTTLLSLPVKKIFTTNVDDLWFKLFEDKNIKKILHDCSLDGSDYITEDDVINYYPLHGCVRNKDDYVFSLTDIARVYNDSNRKSSWRALAKEAESYPILFWGWNFDDFSAIEAMYSDNELDKNHNKWFLVFENDKEKIDYLRTLGFNIIYGDTLKLLNYLDVFIKSNKAIVNDGLEKTRKDDSNYRIPNIKNISSYPLESYYLDYMPRWCYIYNDEISKTHHYREISELISSGKNIIVFGIRGCGKTTLMMELLKDYNSTNAIKHYLKTATLENVKRYLNVIGNVRTLLFIDDCLSFPAGFDYLLTQQNVQVVGFDRDFAYESQYHRFSKRNIVSYDVSAINNLDAQEILNKIPVKLLRKNFSTKNLEKDPIIPNFLAENLLTLNFSFLNKFINQDPKAAELFLLICYVHSCGVPCSFDMIYSYLSDDELDWHEVYKMIEHSGKLIQDISDFDYNILESVQDYYNCRSRFFAEKIIDNIPRGTEFFANLLIRFVSQVPVYKICNYSKYRKHGYDADYAYKAFTDISKGEEYYKLCIEKDNNEYTYQQAALYFSKMKDYKKAYHYIEMAKNLSIYNRFSIQNTYAQIFFSANVEVNFVLAEKALNLLEECCRDDKRRSIHFMAYAKCALQYISKYHSEVDYLKIKNNALDFIREGLEDTNMALSLYHKRRLQAYKAELDKF